MPKSFGYLNEGNPLTIKDNEAQEMVNCAVDRGWIEYKDYPVPTGIFDCVSNREVKLSDDYGSILRIINTSHSSSYALNGLVKLLRPDNSYSKFIIEFNDISQDLAKVEVALPVLAADSTQDVNGYYVPCESELNNIADGVTTVNLPSPRKAFSGGSYLGISYGHAFIERSVVKQVKRNNIILTNEQYTILDSGSGYPVIVFSDPMPSTGNANSVKVTWNYICGDCFFIKEHRDLFYAFTITDVGRYYTVGGVNYINANFGKESAPIVRHISPGYPEWTDQGFFIFKISSVFPTDSGAIEPRLKVYRMPFGGSEYLFDTYFDSAFTDYIDRTSDDSLDYMLTTEGNSSDINWRSASCIKLHNDRLFVGIGRALFYSKPSQFDQFPADNFYVFQDNVVDMCKYDSNLAVFTETKSYIIYGAGTDGFVISEIDWKTKHHIRNCAQSIYTSLISLTCEEDVLQTRRNSILKYNHRYAQDISLRVKDSLAKGVLRRNGDLFPVDILAHDCVNRNTVIENRYYVVELRYYESATATDEQVKTFNLVYDVIADGFCLYDTSVKDFGNQSVFKYRTKEFKASTSPTPQAQYHKGIYVKGKGTFKVNVYADGELLTSLTHSETDDSKPLRIILHNMGNKRASTISLEFIGTQGAQIHDWEVYD